MAFISTSNPATNEHLNSYALHSDLMISNVIDQAQETFSFWSKTSFNDRRIKMFDVADVLLKNKRLYATCMTQEMGKTISSAEAEIEKCAWVCQYYAEKAQSFLADEIIETDAQKSMVCYRPMGAVLAVMPWNYPFWQVFRFAAPVLMAGNVGILKHASNVPQCALHIQEVFEKAGFPIGCFSTLLINSKQVASVIKNPKVKAVTLTGSGPAGASVASIAGNHLKPTVLELGGSDPYLILEDADLDLAAEQCTISRLLNAGQSCIGAKRFIVVDAVYEEFLDKFTSKMKAAIMGDPMESIDLGPMARHDLRDEVHEQVLRSIEKGATLHLGGRIPDHTGAFYPPTILTNVIPGTPAYDEEIFGPVAAVIRVKNEKEAILVANDTSFGLGACVFTQDINKGERIAKDELEAGSCFVNQFVKSDPRLPFGGIKSSGYGRELSFNGIREFVNTKTVYIK